MKGGPQGARLAGASESKNTESAEQEWFHRFYKTHMKNLFMLTSFKKIRFGHSAKFRLQSK